MSQTPAAGEQPSLIRVLVALALDYVRWTQLVPMIAAWAFLLLMVGAMLLVNFQDQSFAILERGIDVYENWFGPIDADEAAVVPPPPESVTPDAGKPSEPVRFTEDDLMPVIMKVWAVLALAGWCLGMASRLLFGRKPAISLRTKLGLAGLAGVICTGLFFAAYSSGNSEFHGPFAGWAAMFVGIPFAVWLVSAYSLGIGALIDRIKKVLYGYRRASDRA